MGTAFGLLVKRRLTELGLSQRDFAAQVGLSHGTVNKIINDSHEAPPPPLGVDLERWAQALQINPMQQQYFYDLAALVYIPHQVRWRWECWYEQHHELFNQSPPPAELRTPRVAEVTPPYDKPT